MLWILTDYHDSSTSANQSTLLTYFSNRGTNLRNCSLKLIRLIYLFKILFPFSPTNSCTGKTLENNEVKDKSDSILFLLGTVHLFISETVSGTSFSKIIGTQFDSYSIPRQYSYIVTSDLSRYVSQNIATII
jgi:hypothetical protein